MVHDFVIGGFTDPQGARVGLGALLVGYYEGDDFVFAGKVGTGFDTKLLTELRGTLDPTEVDAPPFTKAKGLPRLGAHWVRPTLVVRVAFIEWTVHTKLRHPRLLGLRPEKVMFPDCGITKGELADYYALVAPIMVPHLAGRPVTLERFHNGIGDKGFFQKNVAKGAPEWLERVAVPKTDGVVNYAIVRDARGIAWLANQNCITPRAGAVPSRSLRLRSRSARGRPGRAAGGDAAAPGHTRGAGAYELGEDVGFEGVPRRGAARWQGRLRRRRAVRTCGGAHLRRARSGAPDAGVLQGGPGWADSRGHRAERVRGDVRRGVRRAAEA
jgi:hypothetical protein